MKVSNLVCTAIGCGIGVVIGILSVKQKYQKIADEEVKSVISEFSSMSENNKTQEEIDVAADKAEAIRRNYATPFPRNQIRKEQKNIEKIDDMEFDSYEDDNGVHYATDTLYHYSDGVVANSDNQIIKNIDDYIGIKKIVWNTYDDALYFRNHDLKMDIELLKEERPFSEIKKRQAYYEDD